MLVMSHDRMSNTITQKQKPQNGFISYKPCKKYNIVLNQIENRSPPLCCSLMPSGGRKTLIYDRVITFDLCVSFYKFNLQNDVWFKIYLCVFDAVRQFRHVSSNPYQHVYFYPLMPNRIWQTTTAYHWNIYKQTDSRINLKSMH